MEKRTKRQRNTFFEYLIPYDLGLRLFQKNTSLKQWACPLHLCKKLRISIKPLWRNDRKKLGRSIKPLWRNDHLLQIRHFIPYNPGLRIFSEKQCGSNDGPYCPLHLLKKLGKSLEQFWRKGQIKQHLFWTLNPLLPRIKNFFRKPIWFKRWALLSYTHAKNWKILRAVLEKRQKPSH